MNPGIYLTDTTDGHFHCILVPETETDPILISVGTKSKDPHSLKGSVHEQPSLYDEHSHYVERAEAETPQSGDIEDAANSISPGGSPFLKVNEFIDDTGFAHGHDVVRMLEEAVHSAVPKDEHHKGENEESRKDEILDDVYDLYKRAKKREATSMSEAEKSEKYFMSEQYAKEDEQGLEAEDRAAIVANVCKPAVGTLSGIERGNRYDIVVYPLKDGEQPIADVVNIRIKQILETNYFKYTKSDAVEDKLIVGRGVYVWDTGVDVHMEPHLSISRWPYDQIFSGPHFDPRGTDREYMILFNDYSPAQAVKRFPRIKDKIGELIAVWDARDQNETEESTRKRFESYFTKEGAVNVDTETISDMIDIAEKNIRILYVWRKEYYTLPVFIHDSGYIFMADPDDSKQLAGIEAIPNMTRIDTVGHRMRKTVVAGHILIEDLYPDLVTNDFPAVIDTLHYRRNQWTGILDKAARDMQDEVNKRFSQNVDIINCMSSWGWFYDSNTFPTHDLMNDFEDNVTTPGFTQQVSDLANIPKRVEGIRMPSEVIQLTQNSLQLFKQIVMVPDQLTGANAVSEESGVVMMERKKSALLGHEKLFDTTSWAMLKVGEAVVGFIQKYDSPDTLMRSLETAVQSDQNVMVDGKKMTQMEPEVYVKLLERLQEADLTKYGVRIGERTWAETTRRASFMSWSLLASRGVQVPQELLVSLSDLENKEEVIQMIQAQRQAEQETELRKSKTELDKASIAAGGPQSEVQQS